MSSLLAQNDQSEYANQQSERISNAAEKNKKWASALVAVLLLAGVIGGGVMGSSGGGGGPVGGLIGAFFGGFGALVVGMAFYAKRRLESEVALRMEKYFRGRERTRIP